ncbi:MAG: hypothetical protein DI626_08955, partial [Micavibrio aeruginosavorus]
MASNNIIMAVPSANTSVNYDLPANENAKLSFSPSDIDGLKLDGNGSLVISFVEGGNVTINNFQSFVDNGNTLTLADGTAVDPKLLFEGLGGINDNRAAANDLIKIGVPADGATEQVTLEKGQKYLLDFDLTETQGADMKNGQMVINFENGGKIVIANYEQAMKGADAPELNLASKTCIVTGDDLITNIQAMGKTATPEVAVVEEEKENVGRKSKVADADMEGKEDIGPGNATKLAYKAPEAEPTAEELAEIETAAGGAGRPAGGGYGFNSRPGTEPFQGKPDIGPLGQTQLSYEAPRLDPGRPFIDQPNNPPANSGPLAIGPAAKFIDETNLANGPVKTSGSISIDYGADGPGGVAPNGGFSSGGSQTGGQLSSNGVPIVVTVVGNSYVGTTLNGVKVFQLDIDPTDGDFDFTQFEQLDHANGNDANDQIVLNFGLTARDGDGDSVGTTVQIVVADDAPTASGATGEVDETKLSPVEVTGNLTVDFGQDGAGTIVTTGSFEASGSVKGGVLMSSGVPIVVESTPSGYLGRVGSATGPVAFELTLNQQTGAFTYTQRVNLDHADNNDENDIITLTFGTNVVDYDGDKAPAPIIINIKDDAPTWYDCGCPGKPTPGNAEEIVDETFLANGSLVRTGQLVAEFGADKPGTYEFKDGSFVSSGSKLGGNLTHNGVPVVVAIENGVYVGKAGNLVIFTMAIDKTTGNYKYEQFEQIDHADGTNPDDVISFEFTVVAKDFEGDAVEGKITVKVLDDAPDAVNDGLFIINQGETINGNVTSNDNPGQDTPGKVVKVAFGNQTFDVPVNGQLTVNGAHGVLKIDQNGVYTYTANGNAQGIDSFTYTLRDFDGDTDTATLEICVNDIDTTPVITPATETVDETALAGGVITETGSVTANFFGDGPGTFSGNNVFSYGGSALNGNLTHQGQQVAVSFNSQTNTYTGVANGITIFTLSIADNGSYEFKLYQELDHADGNNAD